MIELNRKYPIYSPVSKFLLKIVDMILEAIFFNKKTSPPHQFQRILISNIAHLGDVILTTALIPPLRAAYPDSKIGMLIGSWSKEIVENHPLIDWIHVVDHWKINRTKKGVFARYFKTRRSALKEIKEKNYDLSLDCNFHFPNMAPLLWQTKIPHRIGFESAGFSPFLTHAIPWNPRENKSAIDAFFALAQHYLPNISTCKKLAKPNLQFVSQKKENYIVLHIGSGDEKKDWDLQKWRQLAEKLVSEGFQIRFTGKGKDENNKIKQVSADLPNTMNLCDQLEWHEFVSVIHKASFLIGVDSVAGHIASCVATPALLLYTAIHPDALWRPYSSSHYALRKNLSCSPCFTGCASMDCMRQISVEEVYERFKAIMPRPTLPLESSKRRSLISSKRT